MAKHVRPAKLILFSFPGKKNKYTVKNSLLVGWSDASAAQSAYDSYRRQGEGTKFSSLYPHHTAQNWL